MPDGWALQGPDHHFDGQNFSKAFDIKFLDKEGRSEYAWQTTYAISTREFGVMVATHGDDKGLVIPPKIAYIQVIIIPIYKKDNQEAVSKHARKIYDTIKGKFRARIDEREGYSPGFKFNEWELKGIPLRIEIGEKDIANNSVMFARRDTGAKTPVKVSEIEKSISETFERMQEDLYKNAESFLKSHIHVVDTIEEFKKVLKEKGGIISAPWCGSSECELKMKDENGTKITNIPVEQPKHGDKCIYCHKKAKHAANFAKSY
jgi:prolyl-tRNA synthetase